MSVKSQPDSIVRATDLTPARTTRPPRGWAFQEPEGAEPQAPSATMPWLAQLVFWAGIAAIVAGSFWLQIRINALGRSWAETLLVALSVALEFGLLWLWNRKFPAFWTRLIVSNLKRLLR